MPKLLDMSCVKKTERYMTELGNKSKIWQAGLELLGIF